MRKLFFLLLTLTVLVLISATPILADGIPPLPEGFYGSVTINGSPAPAGTRIEVRGTGMQTGITGNPLITSVSGHYGSPDGGEGSKLVAAGNIASGTLLNFYINNVAADQTAYFSSGATPRLNLTVTISSGGGNGGGGGSTAKTPTPSSTSALVPVTTPEPGRTVLGGAIDSSGKLNTTITASSSDKEASVTIEAGVTGLKADGTPLTEITISPVPGSTQDAPGKFSFAGQVYEFGPEGATFDKQVTITFKYDPARLPDGFNESGLVISWYDAVNHQWVNLVTTVDPVEKTVSAQVNHFSIFALLRPVLAAEPTQTPSVLTMTVEPAQISGIPATSVEPTPPGSPTGEAQETPKASQPEVAEPTPGLNWALIGGVFGICVVIVLLMIVFRKSIFKRNR
jgi:hypothetical protein